MMHARNSRALERSGTRAPTNVTLDTALVAEARDLGVNISRASEAGLERAVSQARADRWLRENEPALRSSNAFVESHGLPLKNFRRF